MIYLLLGCLTVIIALDIALLQQGEKNEIIKTVDTEQKKTDIPVGRIKCVDENSYYYNLCSEYVIYRTLGE